MTRQQEHLLITAALFLLEHLGKQYEGRKEHSLFQELRTALADSGRSLGDMAQEHDQGKLPPLPDEETPQEL